MTAEQIKYTFTIQLIGLDGTILNKACPVTEDEMNAIIVRYKNGESVITLPGQAGMETPYDGKIRIGEANRMPEQLGWVRYVNARQVREIHVRKSLSFSPLPEPAAVN